MMSSMYKPNGHSNLIELNSLRALPTMVEGKNIGKNPDKNAVETRSFKRGDRILELSGNWTIQSGIVRTVTWDMDGNTSVLGLWGVGNLLHGVPHNIEPYQYECLEPSILRRIADNDRSPDLWMSQYLRMEELLRIAHCRNVSDRLLKTLYWLADHFGIPYCDRMIPGKLIDLRMTHQQLADLAGTTRVTVTRCLGQFERDCQIVRLRRGRFFIETRD
jgi:CRP-like cAMP-binding protein